MSIFNTCVNIKNITIITLMVLFMYVVTRNEVAQLLSVIKTTLRKIINNNGKEYFDGKWHKRRFEDGTYGSTPEQMAILNGFHRNETSLILPRTQTSSEYLTADSHVSDCAKKCSDDPLCRAYGYINSGEGKGMCHKYINLELPPLSDSVSYSNYVIGYKR